VSDNHTVSASFAVDTFTITTRAGAGGTISPSQTVNYGATATVTAMPNRGYHIEKVLVDGVWKKIANSNKSFSYTFTKVNASHAVSATFGRGVGK
jgi:PleD family two-component response regulator